MAKKIVSIILMVACVIFVTYSVFTIRSCTTKYNRFQVYQAGKLIDTICRNEVSSKVSYSSGGSYYKLIGGCEDK